MRTRLLLPALLWLACNGGGFKPLDDLGSGTELGPAEAGARAEARPPDALRGDGPLRECPGPVKSEDVDDKKEPGLHTSIAIDPTGDLHISHYAQGPVPDLMGNGGYHDARYSVRRRGVWSHEEIYTSGAIGAFSGIGYAGGQIHVVFYDYAQKDLLWAWRDASTWKSPKVIAGDGNVGWGNDLAVDPSGGIHVVTFSGSISTDPGKVIYLRRVGVDWQPPVSLELSAGDQGPKSGIVVAPGGKVVVSLCDGSGQLKVISSSAPGSFGPALILDAGLGTGGASDLAVDGTGDLHVAYFDSTKKS